MVQFLTKTRLALNARGGKEVGIEDLVKRVVNKKLKIFFFGETKGFWSNNEIQ